MDLFTVRGTKFLTLSLPRAREAGKYMAAARRAMVRNDPSQIRRFAGQGVRDVHATYHEFECDLNRVYELDAEAESPFSIHYEIVAD